MAVNTLSELSGMYPLHIVESIEYYRPSAAMLISISATMTGGALVITTKDGSKLREWDSDLFMKTFKPLGYQEEPETYRPHYIYDPTSDDTIVEAAWIPELTEIKDLDEFGDCRVEIEGMTEDHKPLHLELHSKGNQKR